MGRVSDLRNRRAQLYARMESIKATADHDCRLLTPAERRRWDEASRGIDEIDLELPEARRTEDRLRELRANQADPVPLAAFV